MSYTKEEIWELLENADVIVKVKDGYLLNSIFKNTMSSKKRQGFCINYPSTFAGLSDTIIYKKVMDASKVPLMFRGDMSYLVRTQTKESTRTLKAILKKPDLDYEVFINSTKAFYESGVTVPGFAKYLANNIWETVYGSTTTGTSTDTKGII